MISFIYLIFYHQQILSMDIFKRSNRVSVYLSTDGEVCTKEILNAMFAQRKEVILSQVRSAIDADSLCNKDGTVSLTSKNISIILEAFKIVSKINLHTRVFID